MDPNIINIFIGPQAKMDSIEGEEVSIIQQKLPL